MKVWIQKSFLIAGAVAVSGLPALGQAAESALGGIRLYDTGVDVVRRLGSPTDIQAITFTVGQAGGGGGTGGAGGTAAPPPSFSGGSRGGPVGAGFAVPPFGAQEPPPVAAGATSPTGAGPGGQGGGTAPVGPGGAPGGTAGSAAVQYVRWIYQRGSGQSMNVILNKFNKVVQIEVIGVSNPNVRTSRGIRLGSSLADVIRAYRDPDSYEIGANYFMVKFLQQSKVAFRLTREHATAPYRVTGIVVSAGKA